MTIPPSDHCTAINAQILAARIQRYWLAQGYPAPTMRLEPMAGYGGQNQPTTCVRSDKVGGRPRREK